MKIKVDMHIHPNLPKSDQKAMLKAYEWWKVLKKKNIRCIISAEHSYKDSKRNFEIMAKTAPKGFVVFPGAEIISKEGVDIVVFYRNDSIYKEKKILTPYSMKIGAIVDYLNKKDYPYYISHPFTLGTTSIIKNLGEEKAVKVMDKAKSIEIHNTAFSGTAKMLRKTGISKILKNKYEKMKNVENLPKKYWKKIRFISGGSDAHKPSDLGSYVVAEAKSLKPAEVYRAITTNKKDIFCINDRFCVTDICLSLQNSFWEWCSKKKYKIFH